MTETQTIKTFRTPGGKQIIMFLPDDPKTKDDVRLLPGRPKWDAVRKGYVLPVQYWPDIKRWCAFQEERMQKAAAVARNDQTGHDACLAEYVERVRVNGGEHSVYESTKGIVRYTIVVRRREFKPDTSSSSVSGYGLQYGQPRVMATAVDGDDVIAIPASCFASCD